MAYSQEFIQSMREAQDAFVWETVLWERRTRGRRWYLWMALVALVGTLYALLTANYLFAFIILLMAIILVLAGNEQPRAMLIQIGNNGVVYDGRLYQFLELHHFAIVYHPPETKVLYLQPKNILRPRLMIFLENEDPVAIRKHLKQYLDEDLELREEHLSDIVGRLLKL